MRITPVGVAQSKVLSALGLTAESWQHAEQIFSDLGIVVTAKRIGRSSEPVVRLTSGVRGGFNIHGEGETYTVESGLTPAQRAAIEQYMEDRNV